MSDKENKPFAETWRRWSWEDGEKQKECLTAVGETGSIGIVFRVDNEVTLKFSLTRVAAQMLSRALDEELYRPKSITERLTFLLDDLGWMLESKESD